MGATVLEFRFFNQIAKKKKKKTFMNITQILHEITSKLFWGLIFMVIFTLMLLDVELN